MGLVEHADEWLLFPENIDTRLAIDESSLSNGELYTFVTNRDAHTRECSLIAVVAGTKSEDVIAVLQRIDRDLRYAVEEATLDLSDSMRKIVRSAFPRAKRVIDRFHVQKLACDAVQELRIQHRWDAIQHSNEEMEEARLKGETFLMETPARNCSYARVIFFSSQQTSGLTDRNSGRRYCLRNIPT